MKALGQDWISASMVSSHLERSLAKKNLFCLFIQDFQDSQ